MAFESFVKPLVAFVFKHKTLKHKGLNPEYSGNRKVHKGKSPKEFAF
jgi:hypothetical protein